MWTSIITIVIAVASTVSATTRGTQCCPQGLQHCFDQGSWGCVQLAGPNCVKQTKGCDEACGGSGYAYRKDKSDDNQCVCSYEDASQEASYCYNDDGYSTNNNNDDKDDNYNDNSDNYNDNGNHYNNGGYKRT